jgi:hypothetical protein
MKGLLLAFIIIVIAAAVAYWLYPSPPPPSFSGNDYYWFIDQSLSPKSEQSDPGWKAAFEDQLKCLKCGDRLFMYGIHNQTRNAAAIIEVEIPAATPPTWSRVWKCRRKLKQVTPAMKQKFEDALNPRQRSLTTDEFSAFERIKPDDSRRIIAVLVGDALHSNHEIDIEKTRITDENIADLLNPIIASRGWQPGMLKGVQFHFLLDNLEMINKPLLNDRGKLQRLYATLLKALGAELLTFDTRLPSLTGGK